MNNNTTSHFLTSHTNQQRMIQTNCLNMIYCS
jgi:hypothetical protein